MCNVTVSKTGESRWTLSPRDDDIFYKSPQRAASIPNFASNISHETSSDQQQQSSPLPVRRSDEITKSPSSAKKIGETNLGNELEHLKRMRESAEAKLGDLRYVSLRRAWCNSD